MASLVPIKDTTKSRDLYDAVKNTLNRFFCSFITEDSAPAISNYGN